MHFKFKPKFQDITDTILGHKPMKTDIIPDHKKMTKGRPNLQNTT